MHMFETEARAYAQTQYKKDVEWLCTWRDFEIYRETNRGPVFVRFESDEEAFARDEEFADNPVLMLKVAPNGKVTEPADDEIFEILDDLPVPDWFRQ